MMHVKEKYIYTRSEKFLMALSTVLFFLMSYTYFADISLKRMFFPNAEDILLSTPIGRVVSINGRALRERSSDFEFKNLRNAADLYRNDTIMTGPDSTLTFELADGKRFDIAPNSLVKLSFDVDFSITGVVHIEILKGKTVEVEKKKPVVIALPTPTPKPTPLVVSNLLPAPKTVLNFTAEEFRQRSKQVKLVFKANIKPATELSLHVYLPGKHDQARKELTSSGVTAENGLDFSAAFGFGNPGTYEWEVQDSSGKVLAHSEFSLNPRVQVIDTLPTLGTNNRMEGTSVKRDFDGFKLRWKPVEGPGKYIVKVFKGKSDHLILTKEMTATELILNKNNLILGTLQYSVERDAGKGFIATSNRTSFGFEFLPPEPTAPANNVVFEVAKLHETNDLVFFTWTKTNYTTNYEFELSPDPNFTKVTLRKTVRDNYQSISLPATGRFYWRVRSLANGIWSDYSSTRSLTLNP